MFLESPGPSPWKSTMFRRLSPPYGAWSDAIITRQHLGSGALFKALDFGIDVSIQAATKYPVGHSDAMIGTAVCECPLPEQLRENAY
ncbi:PLP-dependent transferase [Shigella sonnei]